MSQARQRADEILNDFSERLKQYTEKENITPEDCDAFMDDAGKFGVAITVLLKELGYDNSEIKDFKAKHLDDLLKSSEVDYDRVVNDPRFNELFYNDKPSEQPREPRSSIPLLLTGLALGGSLLANAFLYSNNQELSKRPLVTQSNSQVNAQARKTNRQLESILGELKSINERNEDLNSKYQLLLGTNESQTQEIIGKLSRIRGLQQQDIDSLKKLYEINQKILENQERPSVNNKELEKRTKDLELLLEASYKDQEKLEKKYADLMEDYKHGVPVGSEKLFDYIYRLSSNQIKHRPFVSEGGWDKQVRDYTEFIFGECKEEDVKLMDRVVRTYLLNRLRRDKDKRTVDQAIAEFGNVVGVNFMQDGRPDWETHEKYCEVYRSKKRLKEYLGKRGRLIIKGSEWDDAIRRVNPIIHRKSKLPTKKKEEVTDILLRELFGSYRHRDIQIEYTGRGYIIRNTKK